LKSAVALRLARRHDKRTAARVLASHAQRSANFVQPAGQRDRLGAAHGAVNLGQRQIEKRIYGAQNVGVKIGVVRHETPARPYVVVQVRQRVGAQVRVHGASCLFDAAKLPRGARYAGGGVRRVPSRARGF
jgi:hypothetical protein